MVNIHPPMDVEQSEADEVRDDDGPPSFYPFPLHRSESVDD